MTSALEELRRSAAERTAGPRDVRSRTESIPGRTSEPRVPYEPSDSAKSLVRTAS